MNDKERLILPLVVIFLLLVGGEFFHVNASSSIAIVKKLSGAATVVRQDCTITATIGLEIWKNDTIWTGPDGSIGIVFNDDTFLSLGPGSTLVIDEFVFAPRQGNFSIAIRILKGTAAYLSGLIAKLAPESAHFKTPTASIGIRGTKFAVKVEKE